MSISGISNSPFTRWVFIATGLLVLVFSLGGTPMEYWRILLVCGTLALLAKSMPAPLPGGAYFSVAFVIDLALITSGAKDDFSGIKMAVVVAGITSLLVVFFRGNTWRSGRKGLPALLTANGEAVITVFLAGLFYYVLSNIALVQNSGYSLISAGLPFTVAYGAYILLDTALITLCQFWHNEETISWRAFTYEWTRLLRSLILYYILLSPLVYFMAWMSLEFKEQAKLFTLLLFFVPLMLVNQSFRLYMNMRKVYLNTVRTMAATVEVKDHFTQGHSERVAEYAQELARMSGFSERELRNLYYVFLLHDMGKIGISEKILHKEGALDKDEYGEVKLHSEVGAAIVEKIKFLKPYSEIIRYHHERYDGSGYPAGLHGEYIPLGARVLSVADAYDAMTSERPYRKAKTPEEALREMCQLTGKQFDPRLVEIFSHILRRRGEVDVVY